MSPGDAKRRAIVRLADGRSARLIYWPTPAPSMRARKVARVGAKARVMIGDAIFSVSTTDVIEVLEEQP